MSVPRQILPPVMGSVAFLMAEMIGVSYFTVAKAAAVPALLYFFAVGWHFLLLYQRQLRKHHVRRIL